jgi:acyl carrier protein
MSQPTIPLETALAAVNEVLSHKRGRDALATPSTRLEDLGFSSLDVAEVFVTLEELLGHELDPESGQGMERVEDLVHLKPL